MLSLGEWAWVLEQNELQVPSTWDDKGGQGAGPGHGEGLGQ